MVIAMSKAVPALKREVNFVSVKTSHSLETLPSGRGTLSYTPVIIYGTLSFVSRKYSKSKMYKALDIHFTITAHVENVQVDEEGVV